MLKFKNHWNADYPSVADSPLKTLCQVYGALGNIQPSSITSKKSISSGTDYKIYNLVSRTKTQVPEVLMEQKVSLQEAFKGQKDSLRICSVYPLQTNKREDFYHTGVVVVVGVPPLWDRMAHLMFP